MWRGGKAELALQESSPASTMPWVGNRGALGLGELPQPLGTGLKLYATAPSPLCSAPTRGPGESSPQRQARAALPTKPAAGARPAGSAPGPGGLAWGEGTSSLVLKPRVRGAWSQQGPHPLHKQVSGSQAGFLPPRGPKACAPGDHLPGGGTTLPSTDFHWTQDQRMVPESSLGADGPLRPSASQACSLPAHPKTLFMAWRH